jgi:hypothetical protein
MKEQKQQVAQKQAARKQVALRLVTPEEVIVRGDYKRRKTKRRRVQVWLSPNEVPPQMGSYETPFGEVRLKPVWIEERKQWVVVVVFAPEGFKISDHLKSQPSQPSQPST